MDHRDVLRPTKPGICWNGTAALWTISCAILFTGCENKTNYFLVRSHSGEISSAELELCRKTLTLVQSGSTFKAQMAIGCEGSGRIVVRLKEGRQTICNIGYVSFGLEDKFEFVVKDGVCEPAMKL